jgi:hypothetical protein
VTTEQNWDDDSDQDALTDQFEALNEYRRTTQKDRDITEEIISHLSAEDHDDLQDAVDEHRRRTTRPSASVNCKTGDIICLDGGLDDDSIAALELAYAGILERDGLPH